MFDFLGRQEDVLFVDDPLAVSHFQVAVAGDAVTSRKASDPALALSTFRHAGAQVWSVESILFQWLRTAKHPEFRTISRLVR